LFVLYTPVPTADDSDSAPSTPPPTSRKSPEPHAVSDEDAHERVRLYLKGKLEEFVGAANVVEMNYAKEDVDPGCEYDIKNLLATIPGNRKPACCWWPITILVVISADPGSWVAPMGRR
jgi:hypothetical protein